MGPPWEAHRWEWSPRRHPTARLTGQFVGPCGGREGSPLVTSFDKIRISFREIDCRQSLLVTRNQSASLTPRNPIPPRYGGGSYPCRARTLKKTTRDVTTFGLGFRICVPPHGPSPIHRVPVLFNPARTYLLSPAQLVAPQPVPHPQPSPAERTSSQPPVSVAAMHRLYCFQMRKIDKLPVLVSQRRSELHGGPITTHG
jgi:hypothetical protein